MNILNADETGVPLSPKSFQTIGFKGEPRSLSLSESHGQITAMVIIRSDGSHGPIYYLTNQKTLETMLPTGAAISYAENGFMTSSCFGDWINLIITFYEITPDNPFLLIIDAHSSRANLDAIHRAMSTGLHIIVLPGKSTHILQPLDTSVFSVFKPRLSRELIKFVADGAISLSAQFTRSEALLASYSILKEILKPDLIKSSFKEAGLIPLAVEEVVERWQTRKSGYDARTKRTVNISVQELQKLLQPTIIYQQKPQKSSSKRLRLSGILTSEDQVKAIQDIEDQKVKKVEEKEKNKKQKDEKKAKKAEEKEKNMKAKEEKKVNID